MFNHIPQIDIKASLALAHKKHDVCRSLPEQLQFCFFERQKMEVQQRMLNEIFKVRGYPLVLDDGTEWSGAKTKQKELTNV